MSSSSRDQSPIAPRPAVDEWGIYDSQQAGVDAVMELLEKRDAAKLAALEETIPVPERSTID
jgi:hypothetical protein